jgi:hypothetical protein
VRGCALPNKTVLDLLQQLHQDFWPEIADIVNLKVPVVDHTSLHIKGAGTALRQDSAYWVSRAFSCLTSMAPYACTRHFRIVPGAHPFGTIRNSL